MAYNPYQVATTEQSILENLIGAKQSQRLGAEAIGQQKSEMKTEFEKEQKALIDEQERIAKQTRKKKWYEKLAPVISLLNPVAGAVVGGLAGMKGVKDTKKFEEDKLAQMKALDIGRVEEYGGTFLGDLARTQEDKAADVYEDYQESIDDIGAGDILTAGALGATKGYGAGKLGQSLGVSDTFFKDVFTGQNPFAGMGGLSPDALLEGVTKGDFDITDIVKGGGGINKGFLKNLIKNLGSGGLGSFDPTTLFKEDGFLENVLSKVNFLDFEEGGKVNRRNY